MARRLLKGPPTKRSPMQPLLVSAREARELLGWGRDKFRHVARTEPHFPKPWAGPGSSRSVQYVYLQLVQYVNDGAVSSEYEG